MYMCIYLTVIRHFDRRNSNSLILFDRCNSNSSIPFCNIAFIHKAHIIYFANGHLAIYNFVIKLVPLQNYWHMFALTYQSGFIGGKWLVKCSIPRNEIWSCISIYKKYWQIFSKVILTISIPSCKIPFLNMLDNTWYWQT